MLHIEIALPTSRYRRIGAHDHPTPQSARPLHHSESS